MEALAYRVDQIEIRTNKHHKDLYEGNGLPSITTRLTMLEDAQKSYAKNMRAVIFLLLGSIVSAIADIAFRHVH